MSRIFTLLLIFLFTHSLSAQRCHELTIRFGTNLYRLDKDHISILGMFEKDFSRKEIVRIEIEGYTDSVGTTMANEKLAQKRINSVLAYFKINLDTSVKFTTKNFNEANPASAVDLGQNRRVVIKIITNTGYWNIANRDEARIELSYGELVRQDSCNLKYSVRGHFHGRTYPMGEAEVDSLPEVYIVSVRDWCHKYVFYFPEKYFNTKTNTGKFKYRMYGPYCSGEVDSITFRNTDVFKYDSLSKGYYIALNCYPSWLCCGGVPDCFSIMPEETQLHFTVEKGKEYRTVTTDTLIWYANCSGQAMVFSMAMFDDRYYYLIDSMIYYRIGPGEKNGSGNTYEGFVFYYPRDSFKPFEYTQRKIIVRMRGKGTPGYYLKEFEGMIPLQKVRKNKYRSPELDYESYEFPFPSHDLIGVKKDTCEKWEDKYLKSHEMTVKKKIRKKKTVMTIWTYTE